MIEKTIETKFKAEIVKVATTYAVNITGFWDTAILGKVKKDEPPFIRVTCHPRIASDGTGKLFRCQLDFEIVSLIETDSQKIKFGYWCEQVNDLLTTLVNNHSALSGTTYSDTSNYVANGFSQDGGEIFHDKETQSWQAVLTATLHWCKK